MSQVSQVILDYSFKAWDNSFSWKYHVGIHISTISHLDLPAALSSDFAMNIHIQQSFLSMENQTSTKSN